MGRSLLPRVAAKLLTGLTADCTELSMDTEARLLRQTRPAFGGNIMATILCKGHRPQMATVRHKVMKAAKKLEGHTGKITEMNHLSIPAPMVEVLDFVAEKMDTVNLTEADFIVSGGRGLRDPKNFSLIEDLAKTIGGAVGASRAAVDANWIPYSHQVGQTGKTVNPKIYIACGISGAIQHLAGMKSSDIIVAINSDPHAPIFDVAHFGVVGDLFEVIPELIKQIKA
jgi:electron transfer flavoprotein alpha subunit